MTDVRVQPAGRATVLHRYHEGVYYEIQGPTDIPARLAARLLKRGDVTETDAATVTEEADADYDPGDYSVPVVVAYLEDHPELVAQVVEAEAAGKGRKGILELVDG